MSPFARATSRDGLLKSSNSASTMSMEMFELHRCSTSESSVRDSPTRHTLAERITMASMCANNRTSPGRRGWHDCSLPSSEVTLGFLLEWTKASPGPRGVATGASRGAARFPKRPTSMTDSVCRQTAARQKSRSLAGTAASTSEQIEGSAASSMAHCGIFGIPSKRTWRAAKVLKAKSRTRG
eukprot:scaffold305752_cov30-Tisochrysis_lutea.AAC.4